MHQQVARRSPLPPSQSERGELEVGGTKEKRAEIKVERTERELRHTAGSGQEKQQVGTQQEEEEETTDSAGFVVSLQHCKLPGFSERVLKRSMQRGFLRQGGIGQGRK